MRVRLTFRRLQDSQVKSPMPIDLLRKLTGRRLPCWIDDPVVLDELRLLRAAELVAVMFVSTHKTALAKDYSRRAHVLAITKKGRRACDACCPGSIHTLIAANFRDGTG